MKEEIEKLIERKQEELAFWRIQKTNSLETNDYAHAAVQVAYIDNTKRIIHELYSILNPNTSEQ